MSQGQYNCVTNSTISAAEDPTWLTYLWLYINWVPFIPEAPWNFTNTAKEAPVPHAVFKELFFIQAGERQTPDAGLIPVPAAPCVGWWSWVLAVSELDGKLMRNLRIV